MKILNPPELKRPINVNPLQIIKQRAWGIFKSLILIISYLIAIPALTSADDEFLITEKIINEISISNMMNTISDLQENRDVNKPSKLYKSRYCLRVNEASDPTDGACDNAADYIYNKFSSYGLDVEYDPFIHTVTKKSDDQTIQENYKMKNVVATLPGKGLHKDMTYIICSHYDSTAGLSAEWLWKWKELPAPGADDNASGTAVVLEAARILSQYEFDFTIKFITFSGEELGMFGSKHYANNALILNYKIAGVLNLDMLGYDPNELDIDITANEDSEWLANAIKYVQDEHNINITTNEFINPKMIFSDHSSFWNFGYSAVLVSEGTDSKSGEFSPVNHTAQDTIEKINTELLLNSSKLMIATLTQLADPVVDSFTDLAIKSMRLTPYKSKNMMLNADIKNLGNQDAKNVTAQIWLIPPENWLSPKLLKEIIFDVNSMSSYELSEIIHLNDWGDYTVIIKVNNDFNIFESNFTNNMARRIVSLSDEFGINSLKIYPNPVFANRYDDVNIRYSLSQDANVTINIYNLIGELVYTEEFKHGENGGKRGPNNNIKWNFRSMSGQKPIASGLYIFRANAIDEIGESRIVSGKIALIW